MFQTISFLMLAFFLGSCSSGQSKKKVDDTIKGIRNYSKVRGWPEGITPIAPAGFKVTKFAEDFRNPRWAYVMPNGDILISEAETMPKKIDYEAKALSQNLGKSANRITLLRDANRDGKPEVRTTFLENLEQPFGMLELNGYFYVANTDGIWRYPYKKGSTKITSKGEKILDLPKGGYNNHWTRNIISSPDKKKIYVSVGSASNVGEYGMEEERRRANILIINPDGTGEKIFAGGLRNPVGMDFHPETKKLWTAVNERDGLGDDLVPDYLTKVKENGFYGWPYVYGTTLDPRRIGERDDLLNDVIQPDVLLGSHTASLGLTFFSSSKFGRKYKHGAFIGQHGSWNSSELVGYKVVFVPFKDGKPTGGPEDFLTGFFKDKINNEVYGRPVCVTELPGGRLLVCDDSANTLWLIEKKDNMTVRKTKTGYLMVLEEGENSFDRIEELAMKEKIKGATFSAMGFVKAKFAFFDSEQKRYLNQAFPGMELASFSGSIAWEKDKPSLHAHGVVTGSDFKAYGGHIQEAIVDKGSMEITIVEHGIDLNRVMDEELGAKILR